MSLRNEIALTGNETVSQRNEVSSLCNETNTPRNETVPTSNAGMSHGNETMSPCNEIISHGSETLSQGNETVALWKETVPLWKEIVPQWKQPHTPNLEIITIENGTQSPLRAGWCVCEGGKGDDSSQPFPALSFFLTPPEIYRDSQFLFLSCKF
jgi:hypothetical protein